MHLALLRGTFWLLTILQLANPTLDTPLTTGIFGRSVQERPLKWYRIGEGDIPFVLVGTIHAGYEANTEAAVRGLLQYFAKDPYLIDSHSLYFIPVLNPDGKVLDIRHNSNLVDLNRNWSTPDWTEDIPGLWSLLRGEGGEEPFSEPETHSLQNYLLKIQQNHPWNRITVVFMHSLLVGSNSSASTPKGLVQPAYRLNDNERHLPPHSLQAADIFAEYGNFTRITSWTGDYPTPGEAIHWAALQGMMAMDIEFPTAQSLEPAEPGGNSHYDRFHSGIIALLKELICLSPLQPAILAE